MAEIGSPTLLNHLRLSSATANLRRQAETARSELVTGRIADLPKALGGRLGGAQLLRKALDDLAVERAAIDRAGLRANVAQSTLGAVSAGASGLNASLLAALGRGDQQTIANSAVEARSQLGAAFAQLNVRVEGRSLFAGDAGDRPALASADILLSDIATLFAAAADAAQFEADLDVYFNDPAGGFRTVVYQGGAGDAASLEIAPGETVIATARADEQGVKDMIRGLSAIAVAATAGPSSKRDQSLAFAGATLLKGDSGVLDLRTRIGLEEARAEDARMRIESEEVALTAAYNAMTSRDPFEAASRLQALESQIEASFVLTSRLSRLSLTNFLR